jgi:hypothetical protein
MDWKNIKTTLSGYLGFLLGLPFLIQAFIDWSHNQPVQWKFVLVSAALGAIAYGLQSAKDKDNHSTPAQVKAAGATAAGDINAPAMVKAADKQAEGK